MKLIKTNLFLSYLILIFVGANAQSNASDEIVVEPKYPYLKIQLGAIQSESITVSKTGEGSLNVTEVTCDVDFLKATVTRESDKKYTITLSPDQELIPLDKNRLKAKLLVSTENDGVISISVTASVTKPIEAKPNSVYFYASDRKRERIFNFKISSTDEFSILKIENQLNFIEVTNAGNDVTVTLKSNSTYPELKFSDMISIHTNHKLQPKIMVPIRGNFNE